MSNDPNSAGGAGDKVAGANGAGRPTTEGSGSIASPPVQAVVTVSDQVAPSTAAPAAVVGASASSPTAPAADIPLTRDECDQLLKVHEKWLNGEGRRKPSALSPVALAGKNFSGLDLRNRNLSRADLRGAIFEKAKLAGTRFVDSNLTEANLQDAEGLLPNCLAGAVLTNAKLPETVKTFDGLKTAEEMSKNSGRYFVAMLAACVYVVMTVATSSDVGLFTDSSTASLPIVNIPINTVSFFLLSPLVLLITFIYFHLDLQRLWDALAKLPAVFPDGRTVDEKAYPWLLGGLARSYSARLCDREFLSENYKPLLGWQKALSILLGWYFVPASLMMIWLQYIHRHHWIGTLWHMWLIIGSVLLARGFWTLSTGTLRRRLLLVSDKQAWPMWARKYQGVWLIMREPITWIWLAGYCVFCFALYGASVNLLRAIPEKEDPNHRVRLYDDTLSWRTNPRKWVPRLFHGLYQPYAQLENANIVARPANWTGLEEKDTSQVPVMLLHNKDLRYAVMDGAFLVRADLRGSTLNGAQLANANLTAANLYGVNIRADLTQASLKWADFGSARLQGAVLERAHLEAANLQAASLQNADLALAHLARANLERVDLRGAKMDGADLSRALLRYADLRGTDLSHANLTKAKLVQAQMSKANLFQANLTEANLSDVVMIGSDLFAAELPRADLRGANLRGAGFSDVNLSGANLNGTDLRETHWSASDLRRTHMRLAGLRQAVLFRTILRDADLTGADLSGAVFDESDLSGADLRKATGLTQAQLDRAITDARTQVSPGLKVKRHR